MPQELLSHTEYRSLPAAAAGADAEITAVPAAATSTSAAVARGGRGGATVLVTGAAGFIGSHLVDLLLGEGWGVVGLDNFDQAYDPRLKRLNIAAHVRHPEYRLLETDVRNYEDLQDQVPRDIQIVVHIAARTGTEEGVANPVEAAEVNFRGALNLLELCRTRRVRQFILASCGSVYGAADGLPWKEDAVPMPVNPLDGAKLATEHFGHCYSRLYGLQFVSARLFNVYGPREHPRSLVTSLVQSLLEGERLRIAGDTQARRDFTYVGDAVLALRLAMSFGAAPSEVFNIGSGESVSMMELVHELETITARRATLQTVARRPGDLLDSWGDVAKARRALGFAARVSLEEGLRRFLDWYLNRA
jgi:UDP-glucuronate 4-epimerase